MVQMDAVKIESLDGDSSQAPHPSPGSERGNRGFGRGRGGRGGPRGRGGMRGGGGGGPPGGDRRPRAPEDRIQDRLNQVFSGMPTIDIPPREETGVRKFTNHNRLFVGNLPTDIKQDEFDQLFAPYGETNEQFLNAEKAFGFVKYDYRSNAEKAKLELDGKPVRGRNIKVRFAAHGAALKVKNLNPWVSNELLEKAFSVFGEIERCVVLVDGRGKPLGEGLVEFVAKPSALQCLKMCNEGCFFLTQSPRPVIVEPLEEKDTDEGLQDRMLPKKHPEFQKERSVPPRFAAQGSFEFEYAERWKELYQMEKQKIASVEAEMRYEREKLDQQMEYARHDHEINMLREREFLSELRQRELEKERQMRDAEMRMREREEMRRKEEEMYRMRQDDLAQQMQRREDELRRRVQENSMFLQEEAMRAGGSDNKEGMQSAQTNDTYTNQGGYGTNGRWDRSATSEGQYPAFVTNMGSGVMPPDPKAVVESYGTDTYQQGYTYGYQQEMDNDGGMNRGGSWGRADRALPHDEYPGSKRRRY
ncbi:unnamed protein product [Darwinula stevensoni]|uniref:RRM domain-containing protein n=1 Tax=Darwinula stevensoni TaxID=69355 RepID=A0A7R8X7Z0_9CRUS|nr:unnamed protein product [Darwinula stevensoni]CAG0882836.1 unnamed protein product [Darwinula stevensoni]